MCGGFGFFFFIISSFIVAAVRYIYFIGAAALLRCRASVLCLNAREEKQKWRDTVTASYRKCCFSVNISGELAASCHQHNTVRTVRTVSPWRGFE
jgi:hypothetical protein